MKTLLLSSTGSITIELLPSIIDKPIKEIKLAWITTASKGVDDLSYLERHKQRMTELGYNFEEIDIEGKEADELKRILENKDVIHVEGGNTFYLLKAVRESGFDNVVKELIEKGVVYVGSSAGSYVACPTIEMATWKKPVKEQYGVVDFTALNLVDFLVFCHYSPEHKEFLEQEIKNAKYPVRILTDEQALLIKDGEVELKGRGEEIKI